MIKVSRLITSAYFKQFALINSAVGFLIIISRFSFGQNVHALVLYLVAIGGLGMYAQINFDLRRKYAGTGAVLLVLFIARVTLVLFIRNRIGVFDKIPAQTLATYQSFLSSNGVIEFFNYILIIGIFLLIYDMYIGVKKIEIRSRMLHDEVATVPAP